MTNHQKERDLMYGLLGALCAREENGRIEISKKEIEMLPDVVNVFVEQMKDGVFVIHASGGEPN